MIQLAANAFTAIRWTAATQPIAGVAWAAAIDSAYTKNPVTNAGYVGYTRGAKFPSLTTFLPGVDYLIYANESYALADADAAPAGAFAAFVGYTPPVAAPAPTTPAVPTPGFVATATAAAPIIGGSIVARTADGVVPHSAKNLDLIHLLFGIALNSALPGGSVSVQRGGYVLYPGLGLIPDTTLFVGDNGKFVTSNEGLAFSQVVGRAISPDELIYQPEAITILYPFSLSVI